VTDQPRYVAPAAWYMDPYGSQQLRWWDGTAWTEQVTAIPTADGEAASDVATERAAVAVDPAAAITSTPATPETPATPVAEPAGGPATASPPELPSRRALREAQEAAAAAHAGSEAGLADEAASAIVASRIGLTASQSRYSWDSEAVRHDEPGPQWVAPAPRVVAGLSPVHPQRASTTSAWLLALSPFGLAGALVAADLWRGFDAAGWWMWGPAVLFLLLGVLLAIVDVRRLRSWGYERPANPAWAFLTPAVYLPIRTRRVRHESGIGIIPAGAYFASLLLAAVGVAVLVVLTGGITSHLLSPR